MRLVLRSFILKPSTLLIAVLTATMLLSGCAVPNPMQHNTCEEPVLASVICSIMVRKKEHDRAEVVVSYHHAGEYGRIYKIVVVGHGEDRDDVIGNLKPQFAYPGRNKAFIPIGFLALSDFEGLEYNTESLTVQFVWLDEARNSDKVILVEKDYEYDRMWSKVEVNPSATGE